MLSALPTEHIPNLIRFYYLHCYWLDPTLYYLSSIFLQQHFNRSLYFLLCRQFSLFSHSRWWHPIQVWVKSCHSHAQNLPSSPTHRESKQNPLTGLLRPTWPGPTPSGFFSGPITFPLLLSHHFQTHHFPAVPPRSQAHSCLFIVLFPIYFWVHSYAVRGQICWNLPFKWINVQ